MYQHLGKQFGLYGKEIIIEGKVVRDRVGPMYATEMISNYPSYNYSFISDPDVPVTKFTGGSWKLDYSDEYCEWSIASSDSLRPITEGFADYAPTKHDAQLMASAPDLYEALETLLLKNINGAGWDNQMNVVYTWPWILQAIAALAKARGES